MVKLQIKDHKGKTTVVPLTRDEYTVGRKEGNTIRLTEENVSRTHARLIKKGDEVHVEDLSRYGTRVNGERIAQARRVQDGDVIHIGDYLLSLEGALPIAAEPVADTDEAPGIVAGGADDGAALSDESGGPTPLEKAAKARIKAAKGAEPPPTPKPAEPERVPSRGKGKKRVVAGQPMLVAVTTNLAGTEYAITTDTMILGRTGENDLQIDHHSISRNHAKVVVDAGKVKMVDLASKNGIRVNGEFWEESTLKSGDIIELGKVQFRYVEEGEEFIFRPEDFTSLKSDVEEPSKKKGGKGWIFVVLLLAVGGGVAAFVLSQKGSEVQNLPDPTTAAVSPATHASETAPPPTTAAPQPAEPIVKQNNAEAINEHLGKAKAAAQAEKWDEADRELQAVLALDSENPEGKRLAARVKQESAAKAALKAVQDAQAKSDLKAAWAELEKVKSLPKESVYYQRIEELRATVGPGIANAFLDEAKEALAKKRYSAAIQLADEALGVQPDNSEASALKDRAKRARDKARAASRPDPRPPVVKPPKPKPPEPKPATASSSGKDLYKEGRKLHNSNPSGALNLYKQAAAKGYSKAYKMIGSAQITLGNTGEAIKAYKRYRSLNPGARDSETVKDIIIRLGGTP